MKALEIEKIKEKFKNIDSEKKKFFFITIIASLIVHMQLYVLMIMGPDCLINETYHQAVTWESSLLRFGLAYMQLIKGSIVAPVLATFISSVFLGIIVNLVIDIFEIKNKFFKYIIALMFVVAPNISVTMTFFYCSDAYMLGLLFSTLAVYLMRKTDFKSNKLVFFISILCIALAMGMYQTYLSVVMVLCVSTLIVDILNKKEFKEIIFTAIKYVITGVLGVVLYYLIARLNLLILKIDVSNYSGANSIGLKTLLMLPQLLPESYRSFFNYFFSDSMVPNKIWYTDKMYIIMFFIMLVSTIYCVIKNKVYESKINIFLMLILILVAPICFGVIEIMVPDVDIHILMACSMIYIIPIFLKILEYLPKDIISKACIGIVSLCSIGIIWVYTCQDNASYLALNLMENQIKSLSNRLVTRIEEVEEYSPEMPVVFLGDIEKNIYLNRRNGQVESTRIFERTWGFISTIPTVWNGNSDSWRKAIYKYAGTNMNVGSPLQDSILETEEYKSMPAYPSKDCIKVIDDVLVVKVGE